jgi:hypothetical protein
MGFGHGWTGLARWLLDIRVVTGWKWIGDLGLIYRVGGVEEDEEERCRFAG